MNLFKIFNIFKNPICHNNPQISIQLVAIKNCLIISRLHNQLALARLQFKSKIDCDSIYFTVAIFIISRSQLHKLASQNMAEGWLVTYV